MVETVPVPWDCVLPNEGLTMAGSSVFLPLTPKSKVTEGNSAQRSSGHVTQFQGFFSSHSQGPWLATVPIITRSACNDSGFFLPEVENDVRFLQADLVTEALVHLMGTADLTKACSPWQHTEDSVLCLVIQKFFPSEIH